MRKKKLLLLAFLVILINAKAEYLVRFIVQVPPNTNRVFVGGSFNSWNPADNICKLTPQSNYLYTGVIRNLKKGLYQYKFSQGDWSITETDSTGMSIEDRVLDLKSDTTVYCTISAWANDYFNLSNLSDSTLYHATMSRTGYYLEKNLDSSYKYSQKLYELALKLNSPNFEARALDLQGLVLTKQGNGQKALEMFFKGLQLKKQIRDSSGISFVYHSIGEIYESLKDFKKAKEAYLESVAWTEKKFDYYESVPLTNIGTILLNSGQIDSALLYANRALRLAKDNTATLILLGDIYGRLKDEKLSLKFYREAVHTAQNSHSSLTMLAEAYKTIASTFYKKNQTDSALYFAREGYNLATKVKNPFTVISTGDLLVDIFKTEKKFDSAFYYQDIILKTKDSIFTAEKEKQIHNIYFNEKLRQQELEAENERYRSQIKIWVLAGVLALLVLVGLGYRARVRSIFYKQLSEIEMRALRAQMNPHFIFNCLASINRYIVKSDTKTASGYLTKFSKLIRLILDNSSNEYISLDAEIQTLKLYLDMESLRFDHSFVYEIQQDDFTVNNSAIPTMIIQPYVENAIWHGLLHKEEKGKLWLRFINPGENILRVEIEDNGIGRKAAQELRSKDTVKTKSYGMQISKDRIRIINTQHHIRSSVTIEDLFDEDGNASGTKVVLNLPLVEQTAASPYSLKATI